MFPLILTQLDDLVVTAVYSRSKYVDGYVSHPCQTQETSRSASINYNRQEIDFQAQLPFVDHMNPTETGFTHPPCTVQGYGQVGSSSSRGP